MTKNKGTLKRLAGYVGRYKLYFFLALVSAIVSNILMIIGPFIIGKGVDYIVDKNNVKFQPLLKIAAILLILYCVSAVFQWIFQVLSSIISNRTIEDLRKEVFDNLSNLHLRYYDRNPHGEILNKLTNDMEFISDGIYQAITQFLSGIVAIIGSLTFMCILSVKITLVVILMTPVCFFIASFITTRSNSLFKEQSKTIGELNGYIEEIMSNEKVVKAFGYEKRSEEKFREINGRLYKCGRWSQFYSSLVNPSTRLVNNITYILLGITGGIAALSGRLSIGNISSFLTYSNQFSQPINNITSVSTQLQGALASAGRVFALLDEKPEEQEREDMPVLSDIQGNIKFTNVAFSYSPDKPLIEDFNLEVKRGEKVAIVGPTGAGKTTIVNLLMRFYENSKGKMLVDGVDITSVTKDSLRKSFGMVLQETWLFSGSIRDNISYGKNDATDEEIIAAAKAANAHSFIKRLPNGYNTIISEGGENLSQGQRQLLTIARAMLELPPMLILDEATSSVDTRTEAKIQQGFFKMMKGRTSFVIAHRLSTIRDADLILVLNNGHIEEQGNHEELLKKKGFYYKLYNSQFDAE
ncbi:ABC transporter ATP-binding protein [Inconstantimicrobium mannanitabidum]|uniref:Sugar ABC transporter ATP-binding protein n=1 Tax=Inconstantimicrobium mannanitabidum TaxID=1604901 RepID=A0ACB5RDY7_9CLOT|nr:ABC transporter ATP-binding protein [Clostridium sp. TW13]GKX67258.1 sugar ABC transporter ATP-binding protein [Clostridium sp. TW13]